jgi:hypothetical protein
MTTAAEIKFALQRKAMELAVRITGVHSVVLIGGDTVDLILDIEPDECGCGLHFVCPLPGDVGADEYRPFAHWLTQTDRCGETLH